LFLKPCSRETYLAFVHEHFPKLDSLYRFRFDGRDFVAAGYRKRIQELVEQVTRKHGLSHRRTDALLTRDVGESQRRDSNGQVELWPESKPPQRTLYPNTANELGPGHSTCTM
jgi:hypothetical protein